MSRLHEDFKSTLASISLENDGIITKDEFLSLLQKKSCVDAIQRAGVDATSLVDYADVIFDNQGKNEMTFQDFVDFILQLRGGNACTVKDMVNMRKVLLQKFERMESYLINTLAVMGFENDQGMNALFSTSSASFDCEGDGGDAKCPDTIPPLVHFGGFADGGVAEKDVC